jgi:hypothetical protein
VVFSRDDGREEVEGADIAQLAAAGLFVYRLATRA